MCDHMLLLQNQEHIPFYMNLWPLIKWLKREVLVNGALTGKEMVEYIRLEKSIIFSTNIFTWLVFNLSSITSGWVIQGCILFLLSFHAWTSLHIFPDSIFWEQTSVGSQTYWKTLGWHSWGFGERGFARSLNARACQFVGHVIRVELEEGKKVMSTRWVCVCVCVCVCVYVCVCVWWGGSSAGRTIDSGSSSWPENPFFFCFPV